MRLLQLCMCNFRQFHGKTPTINLEPESRERNVVLFHGINGSGKTAILNAFTWVLYGEYPSGVEDRIVNKRATREAGGNPVEAWVEVLFQHGHHTYQIRRTVVAQLDRGSREWVEDGRGDVKIMSNDTTRSHGWKREDGKLVDDIVGRILPRDLYGYFFFDGERIERIVKNSREERVQLGKATKTLLGVEVLTRAEYHLDEVRKRLEKQLREMGDPETKELLEKKMRLERKLEKCKAENDEQENNIKVFKQQIGDINSELLRIKSTAELQERRNELTRDEDNVRQALRRYDEQLAEVVSQSGYAVFMANAIHVFRSVSADLTERGQLPSVIKRKFVDELLEQRICICGRSLGEDAAEARKKVRTWRARAGPADVEKRLYEVGAETKEIEEIGAAVYARVETIQQDRVGLRERMSEIERELERIGESLKGSHEVDVAALEGKRIKLEELCDEAQRELGRLEDEENSLRKEIRAVDNDVQEMEVRAREHQLLQQQIQAARDARVYIEKERRRLDVALREKVLHRLRALFETMTVTPYVPFLSEDWGLELVEAAGGSAERVAPSSGEKQVLSLAFIASIVGQITDKSAREENAHLYLGAPDRAEYPMVMDSPFGTLDQHHRRQVAQRLPEIVDQIILLVTKTQWHGDVEEGLADRIAREYVLSYYTTRENTEPEFMMLDGDRYELVRRSPDDFEYTRIIEVGDG
ncbi:MAG: AAA family ATPase [Gemmatimonadota bacterium]|nr:AAA family ATPase [Gemmatimonadota bacterium]